LVSETREKKSTSSKHRTDFHIAGVTLQYFPSLKGTTTNIPYFGNCVTDIFALTPYPIFIAHGAGLT
jgi:hypothetical protein